MLVRLTHVAIAMWGESGSGRARCSTATESDADGGREDPPSALRPVDPSFRVRSCSALLAAVYRADEAPDLSRNPARALAAVGLIRVVVAVERAPPDRMSGRAVLVRRADMRPAARGRLGRILRRTAVVRDKAVA
jgi:hypothetical protein